MINNEVLKEVVLQELDLKEAKSAILSLSVRAENVPFLLERLKKTKNPFLRRVLAISLSDLQVAEAVPILMDFIRDERYSNVIGGIVYAMQNFDCTEYLLDFVKIVCDGNYESRELALQLIEEQLVIFKRNDKTKARKLFKFYKMSHKIKDKENLNYINYCMTILKKNKRFCISKQKQ